MYLPIFVLLRDALSDAKTYYSSGELEAAKLCLDQARKLRSQIYRQQRQIQEFSLEDWGGQLQLTDSDVVQYLPVTQACNELWSDISKWLGSVVEQLNVDELLRTHDGLNLILDKQLPPVWDYNHDIVVLFGANAELFITPLLERGQSQVIVVLDDETSPVGPGSISKPLPDATVLYVRHGDPLNTEQAAALKKTEPPFIHGISSRADEQPIKELKRLARLVHKDHVIGASARRWPTIFTEQFIGNLPSIVGKSSVTKISSAVDGKDILMVSPGPSLRDSLPNLKRFREKFVMISLIRSLHVLLDYEIVPDFAIMIDAQDHSEHGLNIMPMHPMLTDVSLIVSEYTHNSTFNFASRFKDFLILPAIQLIGGPLSTAIHGSAPPAVNGSGVATCAISLVAALGARSITIVGQDLSSANGSYADPEQQKAYSDDIGNLTCTGIDGSKLPTQADYLLFISELEALAKACSGNVAMFNSTVFGAFLEGWEHIPLDEKHPVVSGYSDELHTRSSDSGEAGDVGLGRVIDKYVLQEALKDEIELLRSVYDLATKISETLDELLASGSNDVRILEELEQQLLIKMTTLGSLINFYTCPAKLATQSSLQSVESLADNFVVSSDYYGFIAASANRLMSRLDDAASLLSMSLPDVQNESKAP